VPEVLAEPRRFWLGLELHADFETTSRFRAVPLEIATRILSILKVESGHCGC
jgi:hypothetical protein